jgi:hypothetical protein
MAKNIFATPTGRNEGDMHVAEDLQEEVREFRRIERAFRQRRYSHFNLDRVIAPRDSRLPRPWRGKALP